jgi:cytoskeleton protein RodZ
MSSEWAEQSGNAWRHHGTRARPWPAQREAMGWTVEQVADQLKLAVRQVVALEAGDYASLPGPAVVRGFVRAYAKVVKLDAAPLVAHDPARHARPRATPPAPRCAATSGLVLGSAFSDPRQARSKLPLAWIAVSWRWSPPRRAAWHFGLDPGRS